MAAGAEAAGAAGPRPFQDTEQSTGPYELQDFHLYYTLRFGYVPSRVAFLAWCAWGRHGLEAESDGAGLPRNHYSLAQIKQHLGFFLEKFFAQSQFKRSCIPNAPKVGSGGSLSPRGDWRAPSDGSAVPWLAELARVPDSE